MGQRREKGFMTSIETPMDEDGTAFASDHMKAVIYARVSSITQCRRGTVSLPRKPAAANSRE